MTVQTLGQFLNRITTTLSGRNWQWHKYTTTSIWNGEQGRADVIVDGVEYHVIFDRYSGTWCAMKIEGGTWVNCVELSGELNRK